MFETEFTVEGDPVPEGSVRAFAIRRGGKDGPITGVATTHARQGPLERWRGDIRSACRAVLPRGFEPLPKGVPVRVTVLFRIRRPASHYLPTNGRRQAPELRPSSPIRHAQEPDLDKLTRAVLDALTTIAYVDDSQVAKIRVAKVWSAYGGATVGVLELDR